MGFSPNMTPRGTLPVSPPHAPSGTPPDSQALYPPALLLTPGGSFELDAGMTVLIGRDPSCDIVLEDPIASGEHARIVVSVIGLVVEDLRSTNGLYVNGARVAQRVRLYVGDRILVGTTELSVFLGTIA